MFSRRRSRGHYDPQQYNTGIRTTSASASAAANAFYLKQLGPSAAAEALRRHSLDQTGANAVRDFQATPSAAVPRRANSLTTRSYQVVHTTPTNRSTGPSQGRPYRSPSLSYSPSLSGGGGGPPRRNSLSGRTNSLTRTHTVVNRDSSGRTLSLTTTTIRQMGSFELVQTKDVPIASPSSRLARPSPSFNSDFGSRANSMQSVDSELVGIREEPEEDAATLERRLNRLGDPIDIPIAEEPEEESNYTTYSPKARARGTAAAASSSSTQRGRRSPQSPQTSSLAEHSSPRGAVFETGPKDPKDTEETPVAEAENGSAPEEGAIVSTDASLKGVSTDDEGEESDVEDAAAYPTELSDVSDATASSASGDADTAPLPLPSEPLHREVSPARSALRNNSATPQKTKVSFSGADEPYVYESYEYEDEKPSSQTASQTQGIAAAAAVARSRAQQQQQQQQHPMLGASAATNPQNRRRLVMSQPALNVEKRPSQTSLSGKQVPSAAKRPSSNTPYPHARPWDVQNEDFVDAPSSFTDIPVPARSSARPGVKAPSSSRPQSQQFQGIGSNSALGANGLPRQQGLHGEENDVSNEHDHIHAQAIALAQAAFNKTSEPTAPAQQSQATQNHTSSHHYHSLVADDNASIKSDSSFTRERRRGGGGSAGGASRMRSLRQPTTPSLRAGGPPSSKGGRKGSLLNQAPPNLDLGSYSQSGPSTGGGGAGLRTFSLRNTNRPDPSTLLAGSSISGKPRGGKLSNGNGGSSGGFRSRIADSDSEDEDAGGVFGGRGHTNGRKSGSNGKITLGGVFSPSNDVKDLFKSRASSDSAAPAKVKKPGFFKRVFGKKS